MSTGLNYQDQGILRTTGTHKSYWSPLVRPRHSCESFHEKIGFDADGGGDISLSQFA